MSHGKLNHAGKRILRDPETIRCSRSVHMNDAEFAIFLQAVKLSGMDRGKLVVILAKEYIAEQEKILKELPLYPVL